MKLEQVANEIRKNIIKMLEKSKSGHPGGSLSASRDLYSLIF